MRSAWLISLFTWFVLAAAVAGEAVPPADQPAAERSAADENKVFLDAWSYSRERKTVTGSNRVTARLTLKNVTDQNLDHVTVAITLLSGLGEKIASPLIQQLGTVKPKETKQVQAVAEFIPTFGSYAVLVTYKGGKEEWACSSDLGTPTPKKSKVQENIADVVLLGQEVSLDRSGRLAGPMRVKNNGTLDAADVKVKVTYYAAAASGAKGGATLATKIGEWIGLLGDGKVPGGQEKIVPFQAPQPPPRGMVHYELTLIQKETSIEQQLSGGDFKNLPELECARFQFKRAGAKQENLEISCAFRNGFDRTIDHVKITLEFFALEKNVQKSVKKHVQEVPGALEPGAVQPITFTILALSKYDSYERALGFEVTAKPAAGADKPPDLKFTAADTVEVLLKEFLPQGAGLAIVSAARNGRKTTVKDVVVKVFFFDAADKELGSVEKTLPDTMPPGEERNFIIHAQGFTTYATYKTGVTFREEQPLGKPRDGDDQASGADLPPAK